MLTKDTKLRFWCQKVLPLVYDDSLSYYELLNKVVLHLNQNTENINQLIDFYNTFAEDVEDIIRQMMEDGDFNEIVADTLGSIIAEEYDPTKSYIIFDYCIFESKLYRANGSTTGIFDPEKWDEKTVGYDLTTIQNYIYSLDAGNVAYDSSETYDDDTVGKVIKNLNNTVANLFNAGTDTHDDCNNFIEGLFKYGTETLNIPESGYGFVIGYVAHSKQWKWQIAFTTNAIPHMYKRDNINNSGWSAWKRISDEDDIATLNSAISDVQGQITANVEASTTATKRYKVGEYLVLNGVLYRVKLEISNGGTISPNTNVVATTVTKENYYTTGDVLTYKEGYLSPFSGYISGVRRVRFGIPTEKPIVPAIPWSEYKDRLTASGVNTNFGVIYNGTTISIDLSEIEHFSIVSNAYGLGVQLDTNVDKFNAADNAVVCMVRTPDVLTITL